MDEDKIRSFIVVSDEGSFTRAANRLFLSAVAVKNQIDALEAELGCELFIRKHTGCSLSPSGEIFRKYAETILQQIDDAKTEIEKATIARRGEILAGHNMPFNYRFMGALSSGFADIASNQIIQFEHIQHDDLITALLKRQVNCVFAESGLIDERQKAEIDYHHLISLPVYAIMRNGHALSVYQTLEIEDLQNQELYVSSMLEEKTIDRLMKVSGTTVKLIEKTDRNTLFNRIIKNAVELYPNSFDYYTCIPVDIEPLSIGIYTLKKHASIIEKMISYSKDFIKDENKNSVSLL